MTEKFDYNQRIWGTKDARLSPTNWAALKLECCLKALEGIHGKVLDVGCGGGVFTRGIKHYRKDLELWGVDISKKSIKYAQAVSKDTTFIYGDAYQLPFEDRSFDAIVCFDLLEHLDTPEDVLKEAHRVLKKGGVFHSATPLEGSLFTLHGWLWKLFRLNLKEKQIGHIQRFSLGELRKLFEQESLKLTDRRFSGHLFIQMMDILYSFFLHFSGVAEKDPSFSVEEYLKTGRLGFSKKLVTPFYKTVIFLGYTESRFLGRVPGLTAHLTVIKE